VVDLRRRERRGPDRIGAELGVPARTVSRILCRHRVLGWERSTRSRTVVAGAPTAAPCSRPGPGDAPSSGTTTYPRTVSPRD
jgi:hypothetical protein